MAKLPLTQTQETGGGPGHTPSGTTCKPSYSWIPGFKNTFPPACPPARPGHKHKQDDGGGKKACGGKLHERKPPACDHDDAAAGHCPKSLKSL